MPDLVQQFLDESRAYLTTEYLPRIRASVERLSTEDLWWRPHPSSNSAGNLLLHLAGNVRQWIVSGVGGEPDARDREREFRTEERPPLAELLEGLDRAVADADAVLARLDPATLERRCVVQGREVTHLQAIYHVVEHFSMHTGQIIYIAKMRSGQDLGFFAVQDGVPKAQWRGRRPDR